MQCVNCHTDLGYYDVFCSVCGQSQAADWFHRSAFCFGGFGTRHHIYKYPGLMPMVIDEKALPPDYSYPVHFKNLLISVGQNCLYLDNAQYQRSFDLGGDHNQGYHPVLIPPALLLIPNRIPGRILRFNLLSLADYLQNGGEIPEAIALPETVLANHQSQPAVVFSNENPLDSYKLAFWGEGRMQLLEAGSDHLQNLCQLPGGGETAQFNPCIDDIGDLWFAANSYRQLRQIRLSGDRSVIEHPYQGSISAPACIDGDVHFYLSEGENSTLCRFPHREVCRFGYNPDLPHPYHNLNDPTRHPAFILEQTVQGLRDGNQDPAANSGLKPPVWIDMNGVNHLMFVHQTY